MTDPANNNNDARTASIIAILFIVGFFALMIVVLMGFVDVADPSIAKLVGALFGYLTALLNPIIIRYFQKPN
jgi:hypothetical protein